jgi:hypothetical protein
MQRYVVMLDDAKRLKAAGWTKKTAFCWWTHEHANFKYSLGRVSDELSMLQAPMADEIMEDFPRRSLNISGTSSGFLVTLIAEDGSSCLSVEKYRLVDAMVLLWISKFSGPPALKADKI